MISTLEIKTIVIFDYFIKFLFKNYYYSYYIITSKIE